MNIQGPKDKIHVIDNTVTNEEIIKNIVQTNVMSDPFHILNVSDIVYKAKLWKITFPRIFPFYRVKCNDNLFVLQTIAALNVNFSCASKHEIIKVMDLGVAPSRIMFSNPFKMVRQIKFAKNRCVNLMTFDNEQDLYKLSYIHPSSNILLQICCDLNETQNPLGIKYGCNPFTEAPKLMRIAYQLGLSVVGVSFQPRSSDFEPSYFRRALYISATIFYFACKMGFKNMCFLDIGEEFSGKLKTPLDQIANVVNDAIAKWFPPKSGVTIIAGQGKFFTTSAFTLATTIHSLNPEKRPNDKNRIIYMINDGVYGSFNNILNDQLVFVPKPLKNYPMKQLFESSIRGLSGNDLDMVVDSVKLPLMNTGDWIIFEDMGAYSIPACTYSEFSLPKIFAVVDKNIWNEMKNVMPMTENHFTTMSIVETVNKIYSNAEDDVTLNCNDGDTS